MALLVTESHRMGEPMSTSGLLIQIFRGIVFCRRDMFVLVFAMEMGGLSHDSAL